MRRAPIRSTRAPAASEPSAIGRVAKNAMIPVRAALPVVESTNHGSAMTATVLPSSDTAWATISAYRGRRAPAGPAADVIRIHYPALSARHRGAALRTGAVI